MAHSSRPESTDRWGDRLPRRLGLWSAVAVLVGSTIGGGIFRTPAGIAGRGPAPVLLAAEGGFGAVLGLGGAVTIPELAALCSRWGGRCVSAGGGFGWLAGFPVR